MKRLFVAAMLVVSVAMFSRCSDNPVDGGGGGGGGGTKADSIALAWFQAMADTMKAMDGREMEQVRDADFSIIRNGFNEALGIESDNSIAHLGLSIMEILEINYSSDVWEVIDSLATWAGFGGGALPPSPGPPRGGLLGREYSLLVEVPFATYTRHIMQFPPNLTIGHLQDIISNTIIPALNRSITHLNTCEENADTVVTLLVEDEGVVDTVIIDLGEIYVFDAGIHALRAAFRTATAYDVDLFGPDGTYGWIEDMINIENGDLPGGCNYYERIPGIPNDTLYLYNPDKGRGEAMADSIMFSVLHYNLEDRSNFLRLRQGGAVMAAAHQDMLSVISKLESSVYFIKYVREYETEHSVIKLTDLTGMESELGDPYGPNFAKNFNTIEDVLDWMTDFISGPMEFTEDIGYPPVSYTWTMDISTFFLSPVQDWNSLLPYHRWSIPAGPWIQYYEELWWAEDWDPSWSYWAYVYRYGYCEYYEFIGITYIYQYGIGYGINMEGVLELLDGPNGDPIDLMVEGFPYMPDYTLNGLFPGMTRQGWIDLISMLD